MFGIIEMKKKTMQTLDQCIVIASDCQCEEVVARLKAMKEELKGRKLIIVVVGEARRGKSSLLNAILEECQPLFPVDIDVCTNVVTTVRYGKTEIIRVIYAAAEGEEPVTEEIRRDQIADYVSEQGNPENYKNVVMLDISLPSKYLEDGIVLVDTPGVGSLNARHAQTTYSFLPSADLLLFVSDCKSGLSASELEFLQTSHGYCKNILYPVTMKDTNPDFQKVVEDNRTKISRVLELPEAEIQVIPVSSTNQQAYLKSGSALMKKAGNFEVLEETLLTMVTKTSADRLILPYLWKAQSEMKTVCDQARVRLAALKDGTVVEGLVKQLDELTRQLEDLKADSATWRGNLNLFCNTMTHSLSPRMQKVSQSVTRDLNAASSKYGNKICDPKNYQKVGADICHRINSGVLEIYEAMDGEIADQLQQMNQTLQINLTLGNTTNALVPVSTLEIVIPKQDGIEKTIQMGRNIGMQSMGGRMIGSIVGGVIGGGLSYFAGGDPISGVIKGSSKGAQIGGNLGVAIGTMESLSKYDRTDAAFVLKEIRFMADSQITASTANIHNYISATRLALTQSYEQQISQRQKELKTLASELRSSLKLQKKEVSKQIDDLERKIAKLEDLDLQLTKLAQTITAGKAPEKPVPNKKKYAQYDFL